MSVRIINADVMEGLRQLPDESVHCVVTSPPYFGLRDYQTGSWAGGDPACNHLAPMAEGRKLTAKERAAIDAEVEQLGPMDAGELELGRKLFPAQQFKGVCGKCGARRIDKQIGLEASPKAFVARMVEVFAEVRRVLRSDGSLWLNMGDSYCSTDKWGGGGPNTGKQTVTENGDVPSWAVRRRRNSIEGVKPKDLMGMPWELAFALRNSGWWLRSDIIWAKPNPMPESVTDRPTKSHEYVFLLTKAERYFYDAEAIKEAHAPPVQNRHSRNRVTDAKRDVSRDGDAINAVGRDYRKNTCDDPDSSGRNKRSVWTIATHPFNGTTLLADYVGADGKPYTRSEDCPIHGRNGSHQTPQTGGYGEQPDHQQSRTSGIGDHPGEAHEGEHASTPSNSNRSDMSGSSPEHVPGSKPARKRRSQSQKPPADDLGGDAGSLLRSDDIEGRSTPLADETGSLLLVCSETAKPHSNGSHRTGLAPATNLACSVSAQTEIRTAGTSELREPSDLAERSHASNSAPAGLGGHPSGQMESGNGRKSSSKKHSAKCTCLLVSTDHFATFPPELPEICILAGTSQKGCCAKCGAPWGREVDAQRGPIADALCPKSEGKVEQGHYSRKTGLNQPGWRKEPRASTQTLGWSPSCSCNADVKPCTVLDPFSGAGTTALVADRLQRNAIGVELNPTYAAMSEKRINGDRGALLDLMEAAQ
jgi:DNA modification methylase